MRTSTARRLLRLNRTFYDRFAREFAVSRPSCPPGVVRVLNDLRGTRSLLDVGCGFGRVARALAAGEFGRPPDRYLGIDFSRELLGQAAREQGSERYAFLEADLTEPRWSDHPRLLGDRFDAALCFAVLFHIPGVRRRLRLLRRIHGLLASGGRAAVSVWQFLHVPRLADRVVPWTEAGIDPGELDPGDLLFDWRRGGRGLRYVHHFTPAELIEQCRRSGFDVIDSFRSDGRSRDLTFYLTLRKP